MTYLADESSVAGSKPVELFRFDGTYASYYYTSGPKLIVYDAADDTGPHNYVPIAIERSDVKAGTHEDDGLDITVKMPAGETVIQDYAFTISPPKLKLTVYRQEPSETVVYWIGPVNNVVIEDDGRASLTCPSVLGAALTGNVPDVFYQTPCNHTLYDERCAVPYEDFSQVTTVEAISLDGRTITVGSIGTLDGKLIGGELALGTGERRMIVEQTGALIRVNFPFALITLHGAAIVAAGCDQAYSGDCKSKFDNQLKFGGFIHIPPINPFIDGIEPVEDGVADDACVFTPPPPTAEWASLTFFPTYGPEFGVVPYDKTIPTDPGAIHVTFKRAGEVLFTLLNTDNYFTYLYDVNGFVVESTAHIYKPEAAAFHGEVGWDTDPFAAGLPDALEVFHQFPSGSFQAGLELVTFNRPEGVMLASTFVSGPGAADPYIGTPYGRIEQFWPTTLNYTLS